MNCKLENLYINNNAGDITDIQGDITDIQGDITTIQGDITSIQGDITSLENVDEQLKADIGIVENTDTAIHTIATGQYVIWKGSLYTARAAIPAGSTLSLSNLLPVTNGGLNDIINASAKKEWTLISTTNFDTVDLSGYSEILIAMFNTSGNCNFANVFPVSMLPTSGDKYVGVFDIQNSAWVRIVNGNSFRMGNATDYPGRLYAR